MDDATKAGLIKLSARLRLKELEQKEGAMGDVIKVAADIGNATSVVAVEQGGKVAVIKWPTAKAAFGLRLPAKLAADEPVITRDGVSIAIGNAALRYADEPTAARGHQDRYGAYTLDIVLAAIAATVKAEAATVRLAVTVPASFYDAAAPIVTKAMKRAHSFSYQGKPRTVTVASVQVVKEGYAAWLALAGQSSGDTIIIDGGGGTTHVALARGEKFIDSVTRATGLQRVLDAADDTIREQHGRRLTMLERAELEQALAAGKPYQVIIDGARVPVDAIARGVYDAVAGLIMDDIKAIVPRWRSAGTIWLCGGQAHHLADAYRAGFPGIKIAPKPEELNARGALTQLGATEVLDVAA